MSINEKNFDAFVPILKQGSDYNTQQQQVAALAMIAFALRIIADKLP